MVTTTQAPFFPRISVVSLSWADNKSVQHEWNELVKHESLVRAGGTLTSETLNVCLLS